MQVARPNAELSRSSEQNPFLCESCSGQPEMFEMPENMDMDPFMADDIMPAFESPPAPSPPQDIAPDHGIVPDSEAPLPPGQSSNLGKQKCCARWLCRA